MAHSGRKIKINLRNKNHGSQWSKLTICGITAGIILYLLVWTTDSYYKSINEIKKPANKLLDKSLNYSQCSVIVKEENIHFIENNETRDEQLRHEYPLFLFSCGGSGNTMTRILLEYTTNIWTGAIYHTNDLFKQGFKGEKTCKNVMVVKAHPEHQKPQKIRLKDSFKKECLEYQRKIGTFNVIYNNMSAIFIIRDFWHAMFALYQWWAGDEPFTNGHVQHKMLKTWNGTSFAETLRSATNRWIKTFEMMHLFDKYNFDYIIIKYENLINLTHTNIAINEMMKMLKYLYNDNYYNEIEETLMTRMNCIFNVLMKKDYKRLGAMHRQKANSSIHLTFSAAFQFVIDNHLDIICSSWNKIKEYAVPYGYQNIANIQC